MVLSLLVNANGAPNHTASDTLRCCQGPMKQTGGAGGERPGWGSGLGHEAQDGAGGGRPVWAPPRPPGGCCPVGPGQGPGKDGVHTMVATEPAAPECHQPRPGPRTVLPRHMGPAPEAVSCGPLGRGRGQPAQAPARTRLLGSRPNRASPRREGEELFFFRFVPQTEMLLILNV